MENKRLLTIGPTTFYKTEPPDVTINLKGEKIPAHKAILIEKCPYFSTMFSDKFKESQAGEVCIDVEVDVSTFKAMIGYLYTDTIDLSTANLEGICTMASFFQLDDLKKFCCDLFKQNLDCETVDYIHDFGNENNLSELSAAALDFKVQNFEIILKSRLFLKWKLEYVLEILRSDRVVHMGENSISQFAIEWLNFDYVARSDIAAELVDYICTSFISKTKLTKSPDNVNGLYMFGFSEKTLNLQFERYNPIDGSVTVLQPPTATLSKRIKRDLIFRGSKVASMVAHKKNICLVIPVTEERSQVEVYDPLKDSWKFLKSIESLRTVTCSFKSSIYLFHNDEIKYAGLTYFQDVVYCVETGGWRRLPLKRKYPVTSANSCGDSIYMTGVERGTKTTELLQYTPSTSEWSIITCPYKFRTYHKEMVTACNSNLLFIEYDLLTDKGKLIVYNTNTKKFIKHTSDAEVGDQIMIHHDQSIYFLHTLRTGKLENDVWRSRYVEKIDANTIMASPIVHPAPEWKTSTRYGLCHVGLQ